MKMLIMFGLLVYISDQGHVRCIRKTAEWLDKLRQMVSIPAIMTVRLGKKLGMMMIKEESCRISKETKYISLLL